jgi:hypothetical protein
MNWNRIGIALLLFCIAAVVAYKLHNAAISSVELLAESDPECDLRKGSCSAALIGGGGIEFAIEPRSIPVMKPLRVSVKVSDIEAESVEIDFVGRGMEMGYNRTRLEKRSAGYFEGAAILPVCVLQRMPWEARLLLESDRGTIMAPFRFYTEKSSSAP